MNKRYVLTFLSITLLWAMLSGLCIAEPTNTPPDRLTLSACTRIALEQSPLLKVSAQDQIASREAVGEARASYYPTLGVRGGVSRWQSHAFMPSGFSAPSVSSTVGPTDDWSAGGFARYTLYDGGGRRAALDSAQARAEAVDEDSDSTRLNVLFDVHQTFYGLAAALELETVARKSLANAESHFSDAKNRQAAGDTTEAEVLRAHVEVDNAQSELIRAMALIDTARGDLNVALGLPAEQPVEIVAEDDMVSCSNGVDVAELATLALAVRPEIKAMQRRIEGARHQIRAAQAAFRPKVYAEGGYGWRDDSASLDDEAWSVGVTVELTAFDGFARRRTLARVRAEAAREEARLQQIALAIRRDVWSAHARVREAAALVSATAAQAQHANESVRLMAARYKVGAVTVTDLLDAQTALTAAEVRHVQARWSCRLAQSALKHATGTLMQERVDLTRRHKDTKDVLVID